MQIIQSKLLKKTINLSHGFTTKDGGQSVTPYSSLNLAFHVGDKEANVLKNHEYLAKKLNYKRDELIYMKQVHSNNVYRVKESDNFQTPKECDALITNLLNRPLMVMVADCSGMLFYDDERRVIAVAHAGREGAFKNITTNVLNSFKKEFNSKIENIKVVVSASICAYCYEVGEEIYKSAKCLGLEYAVERRDSKFYLNISYILKTQLLSAGIKETNIEISQECSCCQHKKYFSYRAEGNTGRFCGVVELN